MMYIMTRTKTLLWPVKFASGHIDGKEFIGMHVRKPK